jgi:O-methyltransferase
VSKASGSRRCDRPDNATPSTTNDLVSMKQPVRRIKGATRGAVRALGYDIGRYRPLALPPDYEPEIAATVDDVRPFTMTTPERVYALCVATEYIVRTGTPGAIVECGVWRGGSMMAVARTLLRLGSADRDLYLFDTFEGQPPPGIEDVSVEGGETLTLLEGRDWCGGAPEDDVRKNLLSVGYGADRLHLVKGMVEETIPAGAPDAISLLRLDTDWYGSTKHELVHLYPRLEPGGVLIIDDYGDWRGAKQAVDEYVQEQELKLLLTRIDGARIAVKPNV